MVNKEFSSFKATMIKIDISQNKIEELGDTFGLLVNLEYLDVSGNKISVLPTSLTNCKNLKVIFISVFILI